MALSRSIHPPGGATALLATLGASKAGGLGLLLPLFLGSLALVSIRWLLDESIAMCTRRTSDALPESTHADAGIDELAS